MKSGDPRPYSLLRGPFLRGHVGPTRVFWDQDLDWRRPTYGGGFVSYFCFPLAHLISFMHPNTFPTTDVFLLLLFIFIYSFKGLENHAEILAGNTVYARPSRASTACATNSFPTCWQAGFVANPLPWFFLFFFLTAPRLPARPPACVYACVSTCAAKRQFVR